MRIWHMSGNPSLGLFSRAFANPEGFRQCFALRMRGWKPFNSYWWSKPGKKLAQAIKDGVVCVR